jgi:C4-dicarboxylate-specific signal transduction histidine kinase
MALVPYALVAAAAAALAAALSVQLLRRERRLTRELREVQERMRELAARVEAAEADVAHAVTQAEVSESLLLEKGIADEEDIEAARRRFDGGEPAASGSRYVPGRDGGLH